MVQVWQPHRSSEIVDTNPGLADHPVPLDELDLLFTEEDEDFLAKS